MITATPIPITFNFQPACCVYAHPENDDFIFVNGKAVDPGDILITPGPVKVSGPEGQLFRVERYPYPDNYLVRRT